MKNNKKTIVIALIGIFLFSIVTAGIVNFFSNKIIADIQVNSPLELKVIDGSEGIEILDSKNFKIESGKIYEEHLINFSLENKASIDLETIIMFFIYSDDYEFSSQDLGKEFEEFMVVAEISEKNCNLLIEEYNSYWQEGYCYVDATKKPANIENTKYVFPFGVTYVYFENNKEPSEINGTIIETNQTINLNMKLRFKLNIHPGTYNFEAVAIDLSEIGGKNE